MVGDSVAVTLEVGVKVAVDDSELCGDGVMEGVDVVEGLLVTEAVFVEVNDGDWVLVGVTDGVVEGVLVMVLLEVVVTDGVVVGVIAGLSGRSQLIGEVDIGQDRIAVGNDCPRIIRPFLLPTAVVKVQVSRVNINEIFPCSCNTSCTS